MSESQIKEGHNTAVLATLATHAARIAGMEKVVVFLRDEAAPETVIAVAGEGVPKDLIGQRFGIDAGMLGLVFASKAPVSVTDYQALTRPIGHPLARKLCAGGSAPICVAGVVRGALSAGTSDPARQFGERERDLLGEVAALGSLALEHAEMREELARTLRTGVQALAAAVDIRDSYTAEHSRQVARLTCKVAQRLGLSEAALTEVEFAALLHDVGKIGVPDSILHKTGALNAKDWKMLRRHPGMGADILQGVTGLEGVAKIVRAEHERWDGDGYPDGLRAEQIPLASRIIFACDAYHAITSNRPYRKALSKAVAVNELKANAGTQFCPETVEALLAVLRASPREAHRRSSTAPRRRRSARHTDPIEPSAAPRRSARRADQPTGRRRPGS